MLHPKQPSQLLASSKFAHANPNVGSSLSSTPPGGPESDNSRSLFTVASLLKLLGLSVVLFVSSPLLFGFTIILSLQSLFLAAALPIVIGWILFKSNRSESQATTTQQNENKSASTPVVISVTPAARAAANINSEKEANMSFSSSSKKEQAKRDALIAQFREVTGANQTDAVKYLKKHNYKVDAALNELYNDPTALAALSGSSSQPSVSKITKIFEEYKDPDGDNIAVEGTMALCEAIDVSLEGVNIFALSMELKSPQMGVFEKQPFIDGWKALGCDSLESMKTGAAKLEAQMERDENGGEYARKVWMFTFEFSKEKGARSIALENAVAFWGILLPVVVRGVKNASSGAWEGLVEEKDMRWNDETSADWFEFLETKKGKVKGISKDAWTMFLNLVRTTDCELKNFDETGAWPSLIDEFVAWRKEKSA